MLSLSPLMPASTAYFFCPVALEMRFSCDSRVSDLLEFAGLSYTQRFDLRGFRDRKLMHQAFDWWLRVDSNHRPQHYECRALTG